MNPYNQGRIIQSRRLGTEKTYLHERGCIAAPLLQLGAVGLVPLAPMGLVLSCALSEAVRP